MANVYLIPNWFFPYSIILEIVFAMITALVAAYSFKMYNICKQKEHKIFGIGFAFISASYLLWSIINIFLLETLSDKVAALSLNEFITLGSIGIYLYMLFTLIGLATLAYITLKVDNNKIYSLLIIITTIALTFSNNKALTFHLISSILLLSLILHYFFDYIARSNKFKKNLLIPIAFILLFISHIHFIFSIDHYIYYVFGHITELAGYLLILIRLALIMRSNPEKYCEIQPDKEYKKKNKKIPTRRIKK